MPKQKAIRFSPGNIVATPGALELLEKHDRDAREFLRRHLTGDWGNLCEHDWEMNQNALENGERILSSYSLPNGDRLWIITEAKDDHGRRQSTCLLLPEEY